MTNPIKSYFTVDQLMLLYFYDNENKPSSIESIAGNLKIPRSTAVDHLESLRVDGFLRVEKEGKTKLYRMDGSIMERVGKSLEVLQQAYVYALGFIRQKQLREIKNLERGNRERKGSH